MRLNVLLAIVLLIAFPAAAQEGDFNETPENLAKALLKSTIANLEIGNKFLNILVLANASNSPTLAFQNLWGVVYGGLAVASWNNQITALVLDNITTNQTLIDRIGTSINNLGRNASLVFGDMNGNYGMTNLFKWQVNILQNNTAYYYEDESTKVTYLEAYADALTNTIKNAVDFMVELFKAYTAAFPEE